MNTSVRGRNSKDHVSISREVKKSINSFKHNLILRSFFNNVESNMECIITANEVFKKNVLYKLKH